MKKFIFVFLSVLIVSAMHNAWAMDKVISEPNPAFQENSIAYLAAHDLLPRPQNNGVWDLSDTNLESLDGLQEIPHPETILALKLSHNVLRSLPNALLAHLVYLDISHNPLRELPPRMINGLALLKKFYACSIHLEEVPPHFFDGVPRLTEINLSNNQLRTLPPDLLHPLTRLSKLNLSRNRITTLDPRAFASLSNLRSLRLSANELCTLPAPLCTELSHLETLELSDNHIYGFDESSFHGLINLRGANISGNKLCTIPPSLFARCTKLIELDLGCNQLSTIPPTLLQQLDAVQAINLIGNKPELAHSLPDEVREIIKKRNLFTGIPSLSGQETAPRTVTALFAQLERENRLSDVFYEHPKYEESYVVNLSNRNLESLDDLEKLVPFPDQVITIYANNNCLEELPCETLNKFPELLTLDLHNNRIRSLLQMRRDPTTKKTESRTLSLPNLHTLILNNNKIKTIEQEALSGVPELLSLNLAHNKIGLIDDGAFNDVQRLENCFLNNNNLCGIPAPLFTSEYTSLDRLEFLALENNQLGSASSHNLPSTTTIRFYPQSPQPLRMVAAQIIMRALLSKQPSALIVTLLKTSREALHHFRIIAPHALGKYLSLCAGITECLDAFADHHNQTSNQLLAEKAHTTWGNTLAYLQQKKWDEGIELFLSCLASHPMHQEFISKWIRDNIAYFERCTLAELAQEYMGLSRALLHLCIDAAPRHIQLRLASSQDVYEQQLYLKQAWLQRNKEILMANMKKDPGEESPQQRIELIEKTWSDAFAKFKEKYHSWSAEMQQTFFELTPERFKRDLAKKGLDPEVQ